MNYSELYHPFSHHNVTIGNDKPYKIPTEVNLAADRLVFHQKGFYAAEALTMSKETTYKAAKDHMLNTADPRMALSKTFFSNPNHAVKPD